MSQYTWIPCEFEYGDDASFETSVVITRPADIKNPEGESVFTVDVTQFMAGMGLSNEMAEKITSCLNACTGLKNPEAEIKALVEAARNFNYLIETLNDLEEDRSKKYHGTLEPMIWAEDIRLLESVLEPFKNYGEKI